jgi:hypothetical protein
MSRRAPQASKCSQQRRQKPAVTNGLGPEHAAIRKSIGEMILGIPDDLVCAEHLDELRGLRNEIVSWLQGLFVCRKCRRALKVKGRQFRPI